VPGRPRIGALLVAGLVALVAGAGHAAAAPSTLDVDWQQGTAITVTLADGTPVTATTVIPAGTYAVIIYNDYRDDTSIARMFHLTGPGVDYRTDLNQGEQVQETWAVTFQPNATYTWQDDYRPALVSGSFRTSGTVAAPSTAGASSSSGSGGSGSSGGSTTKNAGTVGNSDVVGSAVPPFRGSLDATVFASGRLSLSRNGKPVTALTTGRWTFSVDDESRKAGFTVQVLHGKPQTVTTGAFVGSHDLTIALKPGRWSYFSPSGKRTTFYVVS
jgi:hypothetical protein